jgi:hypothetical protein
MDGRDKPGHDDLMAVESPSYARETLSAPKSRLPFFKRLLVT